MRLGSRATALKGFSGPLLRAESSGSDSPGRWLTRIAKGSAGDCGVPIHSVSWRSTSQVYRAIEYPRIERAQDLRRAKTFEIERMAC